MKKKTIFAVAAVVLTLSGIAGHKMTKQDSEADALQMANVEALAGGEGVDPMRECSEKCLSLLYVVCSATSDYGYPLYCYDMIYWGK